jgi:hypothetical protein
MLKLLLRTESAALRPNRTGGLNVHLYTANMVRIQTDGALEPNQIPGKQILPTIGNQNNAQIC